MSRPLRIATRRFPPFERAIRLQFEDFCRVHGLDAVVEVVPMDLNPLHDALVQRRGLATPDWDVAFLSTDWLAEAEALGLVENLDPWHAREPLPDFPEGWSPSLLALPRFRGGFWGLPYHDGPQCLIYRCDLLDRAGLDVPTTWDELHAAARRLTDRSAGVHGTVLALFPDGHNGFYDFCVQLWTRGGAPFDATGRPDLSGPAATSALDFLRRLARDRDATPANGREIDSVRSGEMFCEGRIGLMANWYGFAAYGETAPDSRVRGRISVAALPAGPGGRSVSLNVFWVLAMASGSERKPLAWAFMRHCATAEMDRLAMLEGTIGVRRSTWADPAVNAVVPHASALAELHRHARAMPVHPRLSAIARAVDRMIGRALGSDVPSDALLAAAQRDLDVLP